MVQVEGTKLICAPEDETKRDYQRFQAIAQGKWLIFFELGRYTDIIITIY